MCPAKQKPIEIRSGRGTERQASSLSRALLRLESCPQNDRPLSSSPVLRTSPRLEMGSSPFPSPMTFQWGHQVKMRSSGWALTQCDWDPCEKGKVRHKGRRARRRRGEETGRTVWSRRQRVEVQWTTGSPDRAQNWPPSQVLEGTKPAHILISDFQLPEL